MSKLRVAITGGIGSGKSTVSNIIKELGYVVFSADEVYKTMLLDGEFFSGVLKSVNVEFKGDKQQALKEVSALVFKNKSALKALNDYTHPKIMQKLFELSDREKGVVFNEVPLLFEGGYEKLYNKVIVILRNEKKRIESVAIFKHTVIYNDGTREELVKSVTAVVNEICKEV